MDLGNNINILKTGPDIVVTIQVNTTPTFVQGVN